MKLATIIQHQKRSSIQAGLVTFAILMGPSVATLFGQGAKLEVVPSGPQGVVLYMGERQAVTLEVRNISGQDLKVAEPSFVPSGTAFPEEAKKVTVTGLKNVVLPKDGTTQIGVDFPAHAHTGAYEGSLNATLQDASGKPLESPISFYSLKVEVKTRGLLARRPSLLISLGLALLLVGCTLLIEHKSKLSFFTSPDGDYSVSKAQTWLWVVVIIYSFVYVFLRQGPGFSVPETVWWLLGISAGSTGTAKFLAVRREAQRKGTLTPVKAARRQPRGFMEKIVSMVSDDGQLSTMRLQMLFWTLVITGLFLVQSYRAEMLWDVPTGLLVLTGISHAGYLGDKGAGPDVTVAYTDVQPKKLPTAQTQDAKLIIFGQNFALGQNPDDCVACFLGPTKLTVEQTSLPNRLVVLIPKQLSSAKYDLTLQNPAETASVVGTAFEVT